MNLGSMMAETDLILTNSQETALDVLMVNDMNIYMALLQNESLGQDPNQLNYPNDYDGLFKTEDDLQVLQNNPQLLQQHHSQLLPPQVYQQQTIANNYNIQSSYQAHPSNSPPNLNHPVAINNYLSSPPINGSPPQMNNDLKKPPILSMEDYAGPYNFNVYFNPLSIRNPWLYSSSLEKLFITMHDTFPVDFKTTGDATDLFIRATTLYVSPQLNQEIVVRCMAHSSVAESKNNNDVPEHIIGHVLRCQDSNSDYQGVYKQKQHLSVVVPLGLPQPGTDVVRVIYYFVCKNSCPTGINRRPTCVVFTLEDKYGKVLGRRRIDVRVCSCPKRDKEKEEKDATTAPQPRNKKRRIVKIEKKESSDESAPSDVESSSNKEQIINITVYDKQTKLLVLHGAYDRVNGELQRRELQGLGQNENLKKACTEMEKQIKKFKE